MNGWIVLDKPVGIGSTNCVGWVKRALLDATKAYEFTICFGVETDTLDLEGKVVAASDVLPTLQAVEAIRPRFTGPIEQVPPAYSALKVDGKRAYDLARAGELVELKTRSVKVHALTPLPFRGGAGGGAYPSERTPANIPHPNPSPEGEGLSEITLSATVSKGTYIRSLARDIARALGTVGHVTMLRRTRAGPFGLDRAISLDFLDQAAKARDLTRVVLPLQAGLDDIPALPVNPEEARLLRQGQQLHGNPAQSGLYLASDETRPVALVEVSAGDVIVVRGFNI